MASTVANTTLQVATLSIPVALKKIKVSEDVRIERASADGNKISRLEVDSVTGEPLDAERIQRGVWDEDVFKPINAEALAEIEEATKLDAFEITEFIPLASMPWERATDTYFLAPQRAARGKGPSGAKAMKLLHAGLTKTKRAGRMKITLRTRQYLAAVYAKGDALYVTTLAWAEDWAQADEAQILGEVAVEKSSVELAVNLIEALSADEPQEALDTPADDLRPLRAKLIEEALAGKPVKSRKKHALAPKPADEGMEALLEASLAAALAKKQPVPAA